MIERVELTDIEKAEVVRLIAHQAMVGTEAQIEVHDGETVWPGIHQWEEGGRNHMYSAERQRMTFAAFHLASLDILPTNQAHLIVELQVALCLSLTDHQQRIAHR